ncbi:MAG: T9SS type A sorting domain-containing protein [Bacteroidota bacterium]|nr:T9SS type A sorting domain-containing protein [Bacteroidota bacterium]
MKKIYLLLILISTAFINLNAQITILLVNDNGGSHVDSVEHSLTRLGYTYTKYDANALGASPTVEFMSDFDLVYWHTGTDGGGLYLWNGDETENQAIKDYIDGGGMLWLEGNDFLYDKYPSTPQTFFAGEFVYDYLGIEQYFAQAYADDGNLGVAQLDVVPDNGIFTLDPITWRWSTQHYADALVNTLNADSVYQMGPSGYVLNDYYSAIYNERGDGKVLTFAFRFDGINSAANADIIMQEGMTYFEQFTSEKILVNDITLEAVGGTAAITENEGTLQLSATVLPENADLKTLQWSLVGDTVVASIDQNGLLKASGIKTGNGVVHVKAEALDGSGVKDSLQVSISNQGLNEFILLLVNDNANGTDRYMEIDSALMNLDYNYHIYNSAQTSDYPDALTLAGYDLVIWYTGNDGVNLKLWDASDSSDIKFNAPLMQYIADGGDIWLQGLDFMFDIYGGAPDVFVAGDFVYDYLGIATYVAQSHADGDDLTQLDVVVENPVANFTPVKDQYGGLWYADAYEITAEAQGIYKMGPEEYIYSDYYAGVLMETGDAKIFTLSYETARLDSPSNTEALFDDVIDYFEGFWIGTGMDNPDAVNLDQFIIYPNPASDFVTVQWDLELTSEVDLRFYSISGQLVFEKLLNRQSAGTGEYRFSTNENGIIPGIYLLQINANDAISTHKVIVK